MIVFKELFGQAILLFLFRGYPSLVSKPKPCLIINPHRSSLRPWKNDENKTTRKHPPK